LADLQTERSERGWIFSPWCWGYNIRCYYWLQAKTFTFLGSKADLVHEGFAVDRAMIIVVVVIHIFGALWQGLVRR